MGVTCEDIGAYGESESVFKCGEGSAGLSTPALVGIIAGGVVGVVAVLGIAFKMFKAPKGKVSSAAKGASSSTASASSAEA